jgi:hypothetical protein
VPIPASMAAVSVISNSEVSWQATRLQRVGDVRQQGGTLELARRQIDADRDRLLLEVSQAPLLCLLAGEVQDPPPEGHDQTARLSNRDEAPRVQQSMVRVLPPHQRLNPRDVVVAGHVRLTEAFEQERPVWQLRQRIEIGAVRQLAFQGGSIGYVASVQDEAVDTSFGTGTAAHGI